MSDTRQYNEAHDTAGLLDDRGLPVRTNVRTTRDFSSQIEAYVRAEPVKSTIMALGIGYVIGRLRLVV